MIWFCIVFLFSFVSFWIKICAWHVMFATLSCFLLFLGSGDEFTWVLNSPCLLISCFSMMIGVLLARSYLCPFLLYYCSVKVSSCKLDLHCFSYKVQVLSLLMLRKCVLWIFELIHAWSELYDSWAEPRFGVNFRGHGVNILHYLLAIW